MGCGRPQHGLEGAFGYVSSVRTGFRCGIPNSDYVIGQIFEDAVHLTHNVVAEI